MRMAILNAFRACYSSDNGLSRTRDNRHRRQPSEKQAETPIGALRDVQLSVSASACDRVRRKPMIRAMRRMLGVTVAGLLACAGLAGIWWSGQRTRQRRRFAIPG